MAGKFAGGFVVLVAVLAARGAPADEGMWPPNRLPTAQLKARHGFEPSAAWAKHLQRACVRFSSGGSGSFVSADGLVMTNHHVGSDALEKFSTAERDLLETGFYAKTREEELKCLDLELMSLVSVDDVTAEIESAVKPEMSPAEAEAARRRKSGEVEAAGEKKSGFNCQVVELYRGAVRHLYGYRRFTDVRLVMAPEAKVAFFGGDNDNFEFPRFDLDVCFFRVYEGGKPYRAEHHLAWSAAGAKEGDLTIVCGHPGRTERQETLEHLKFARDVGTPLELARLWRREVQLRTFCGRSAENERIGTGDLFGVQNARKANTGVLAALHDPAVVARRAEEEGRLRAFVDADPARKAKWGDAWDQVAKARNAYRGFFVRHRLLEKRYGALGGDLFRIAKHVVRLADERPKAGADRLREYRDSELDSLFLELYSPAPIYDAIEIDRVACGLAELVTAFGADDPLVVETLAGKSPRARAEEVVLGTALRDVAERERLVKGGKAAVAASKDPMVRLAQAVDPAARAARTRFEDEVEAVERAAYAKIAAARFALDGEGAYPDATWSLRFSFGPVRGYREDGKDVPAFTTLEGAYRRMDERKGAEPFALTPRWLERKATLALSTPYNFVCTADIVGGNSGSPVVDRAGEVIGIVFDGNLASLGWDLAYTDERARCVCVDSRGIVECLRQLYDAGPLAEELTRR